MSDTFIFIIWKNAYDYKKQIIEDIKLNFNIQNIVKVKWSDKNWVRNLERFYGANLPDVIAKAEECGKEEFTVIIVSDEKAYYDYRNTSKGSKYVNVNTFDKKAEYRKLTGGGHKIHATNTNEETNHDLTLLFGLNANDFSKKYDSSLNEIIFEEELFGNNGWSNIDQVFYVLNNCCNYLILRNFEELPNDLFVEGHNDIDILCESEKDTSLTLNAQKVHELEYRSQYKLVIDNYEIFIDLRYLGDNYYYDLLEKHMLDNKVYNKNGFYTLNDDYYFYTLMYHGLVQKPSISPEYVSRLISMDKEKINENTIESEMCLILKKWLDNNNYLLTKPNDQSVYFNLSNARLISDKEFVDDISNMQKEYDLLKVENKVLKQRIDQMENSTIWKATKPLRKMLDIIKK